jgi:hypothetical protein
MAGALIRAVPKRTINFAGLLSGSSQAFVLAEELDVSDWREIVVMVKVHSHSVAAGAGFIYIRAYPQSLSAEDPGMQFVDKSATYFVFIDNTIPSPAYLTFNISQAPRLMLVAEGVRNGAGTITATVSIDVSLKDARSTLNEGAR